MNLAGQQWVKPRYDNKGHSVAYVGANGAFAGATLKKDTGESAPGNPEFEQVPSDNGCCKGVQDAPARLA